MTNTAKVFLPTECKVGDVIDIRTVLTHVMETGRRVDPASGQPVPRRIINRFKAEYMDTLVFEAEIEPSIAANPAVSFHFRVPGKGQIKLTWTEDGGATIVETVELPVIV